MKVNEFPAKKYVEEIFNLFYFYWPLSELCNLCFVLEISKMYFRKYFYVY